MKNFILAQVMQKSAQMPDAEGTGKFFVVVGVIAILFVGITIYLYSLDRKIGKLEKK